MLFNLVFASNTILSCLLYFFITAVTAQIFIPIAELAIATGIPAKEAEVEIETHQVQCSM